MTLSVAGDLAARSATSGVDVESSSKREREKFEMTPFLLPCFWLTESWSTDDSQSSGNSCTSPRIEEEVSWHQIWRNTRGR